MEKIHVLEIASMGGRYGIENFIINALRQFDHGLVQVDFISLPDGPFDTEIESYGGKIYKITPLKHLIQHFKEMYFFFKTHPEIEVVHVHGNTAVGCLDIVVAKIARIPIRIVHSHNDSVGTLRGKILHYISRTIISHAMTHRLCCSEAAGKWMFGKNSSFKVVPNAIDLEKYKYNEYARNSIRKGLGIEDKIVIGHVGRLEEQKNHNFLIDVFKIMVELDDNQILMLIGNGTLTNVIERKIKTLNLSEKIIWIKDSEKVWEYLSAMDKFVFPSLWEGLGISLIEAQASGLPCYISESIKEEACITNTVKRLNLKQGAADWARIITADPVNTSRSNYEYINMLDDTGYNIIKMGKELQKMYTMQQDIQQEQS